MTRWIAGKIAEILGTDDDVVIELCFGLIEAARFVMLQSLPFLKSAANYSAARY